MEVQEKPVQPAHFADGVSLPRPGFWEHRLEPFLSKYCLALCLFLVAVACARIISTYSALSLTADEPIHFACGLEYVANHVYRLEPQHPPLSRGMQALGPYLAGARLPDMIYPSDDGLVAIARSGRPDLMIFLMRLGNLPFFLLACLVVGLWGNMFGRPVAVLAVALFTLLPTMLADAGLATTDMALGATVGASFLAFVFWARKPTVGNSVLLGFCTALACLSKFSALGYIPAAGVLALLFYVAVRWPAWGGGALPEAGFLALAWDLIVRWPGWRDLWEMGKRRIVPFAIAVATMGPVIWACYWFSTGVLTSHGITLRLPAPEFFDGVRAAMHHSRDGHGAFLLGQFGWSGWWYYFPVVLLLKTPIAFMILIALGIFVCLRERLRPVYVVPLAFSLGILLPAMNNHVDIGVRHVLPIYLGFAVIAALGLKQLLQWSRSFAISGLIAASLLVWMIVSVGVSHPDYLSYLNAFAGKTPENILVDSNYDWGQNLKFLAKRLNQLGVQQFSMSAMDGVPLQYVDYHEAWYGLPPYKPVNPCVPAPGWNVLSPTIEKSLSRWIGTPDFRGPNMKTWYEQVTPTERLGPLLLYYISPDAKLTCVPSSVANVTFTAVDFSYSQTQAQPDLSNSDIKITKLSNNIYTLQGQGDAIGVLAGSDGLGVFVADGASANLSPKMLEALKQISPAPVQLLVNTNVRTQGRIAFHMNGEEVDLIPVPGGQIVYFRNSNILMAGDFYGSTQYANFDPANGGSVNDMLGGFDTVLEFSGPTTQIVTGSGTVVNRSQVIAHKEMILHIRDRVYQLFVQGKTQAEVLAMHPTASYDAQVPNSKESTERFVVQLYADARIPKSEW